MMGILFSVLLSKQASLNFVVPQQEAVVMASQVTNYAKRMVRLSARIFGEVVRPTDQRSMRVVQLFSEKPIDKRPEIVDYYPKHPEISKLMKNLRSWGLYR